MTCWMISFHGRRITKAMIGVDVVHHIGDIIEIIYKHPLDWLAEHKAASLAVVSYKNPSSPFKEITFYDVTRVYWTQEAPVWWTHEQAKLFTNGG